MAVVQNSSSVSTSRGDNQVVKLELDIVYPNGTKDEVSAYLRRVRIENTPATYTMTVFRFILSLPPAVVIRIQKASPRVAFHLRATYSNLTGGANKVPNNLFEPIILRPLIMNKDIIPSKDLLGPKTTGDQVRFEFAAVPESALTTNKITVSGCYRNATIGEVLVSLLSKTGKQVLLDQPDNTVKYDQVPLLPGNITSNIQYLDRAYGIYKDRVNIYNYYNKIIISPSKFNSLIGQSPISVLVTFQDNSSGAPSITKSSMYLTGDPVTSVSKKNILVDRTRVGYSDSTELNQELYGSNLVFTSDRIDGQKIETIDIQQPFLDRSGRFSKTWTLKDHFANEESRAVLEDIVTNSAKISLSLDDIALDHLDIFRPFHIRFDSESHKANEGVYRVDSLIQTYNQDSKGKATFNNLVALRRVKNL